MKSSGLFVFLACTLSGGAAWAQDPPSGTPAARPRFFERPVDLWDKGRSYAPQLGSSSAAPDRSRSTSDWGQVVRQADGSFAYRELPAPLVRVLEDPSQLNVEAYLAWKLGRARKVLAAAEKIRSYRPVQAAPVEHALPPTPMEANKPVKLAETGRNEDSPPGLELIYFHKKGCPPCAKQNEILGAWLKARQDIRFRVVEFGQEPELWREQRVRGTPSLLFRELSSGRSTLLSGLSDEAVMDRAATQVMGSQAMESIR